MPKEAFAIPVEKLRRVCDPKSFSFADTSEVEPVRGFIGQERAAEALRFGLRVGSPEHHVYATGNMGRGKKRTILCEFLEEEARKNAALGKLSLKDACYLYNFEEPEKPVLVLLEKGQGRKFRKEMEIALKILKRKIPEAFMSKNYAAVKNGMLADLDDSQRNLLESIKKEAENAGLVFSQSRAGYSVSPPPGDNLTPKKRSVFDKKMKIIKKRMQEAYQKMQEAESNINQTMGELNRGVVASMLQMLFNPYFAEYADFPKIARYLKGLEEYTLENIDLFYPGEGNGGQPFDPFAMMQETGRAGFLPFTVNLFVDNGGRDYAPVIFEGNPSFENLFCAIEKKVIMGGYLTNHACLKSGSLALANGGYLVLNIRAVLESPGVWPKLKKTLQDGVLEFEEQFYGLKLASLNPESVPVNLKVVMIGEARLFHLLAEYDSDFLAIFRVKAEFDSEMPLTEENRESYASFISACCQKENLLPFDATAVARMIEQGSRLAASQARLSTEFDEIKDLAVESSYWAAELRAPAVSSEHVRKALRARKARLDLTEEKSRRAINEGMMMVETEGTKVGQINGLAIHFCGDHLFGVPQKITAKTFAGNQGLVNIQRETKMSGPIHDTGLLTLNGYFRETYGKYRSISFSASLSFEQCYGGVEGDSASAAELICLLSSLSGFPVDQSIAITGSVNQNGEIQPIGGVNEKVEGFFDVCRAKGITGGVIIPRQNVQQLMLREDVVEAVREKNFSVFAIKSVDQGFQILTGKPPGEVFEKVKARLEEMAEKKSNK